MKMVIDICCGWSMARIRDQKVLIFLSSSSSNTGIIEEVADGERALEIEHSEQIVLE